MGDVGWARAIYATPVQKLGLEGMPGRAGPQYLPASVQTRVGQVRLGCSTHQNATESDPGDRFYRLASMGL